MSAGEAEEEDGDEDEEFEANGLDAVVVVVEDEGDGDPAQPEGQRSEGQQPDVAHLGQGGEGEDSTSRPVAVSVSRPLVEAAMQSRKRRRREV